MSNVVSIHPYFKVRPGKMEAVRALLAVFVEKTQTEEKCLHYEFTLNGDVVFCREAYVGADGALAHIKNVGAELDEMLRLCDLLRLEFHGPEAELDQLREPLSDLKVEWFVYQCGISRYSGVE
jgi:quinol monooxygenase YgiN